MTMKRHVFVCLLAAVALAPVVLAQEQAKAHVEVPIIAANPEDVSSIEAIIKASYDTISGGVGVARQWGRERTLNDEHARFVAAEVDPKTGQHKVWSTSDQEFADSVD